MKIDILQAGMLTTLQDRGRYGGLEQGLAQAGVMDHYAYDYANALVSNPPEYPVLEITAGHFSMRTENQINVAVTGADCDVKINAVAIKAWESYLLCPGDILEIGQCHHGLRSYLAISGKWMTSERYLDSVSTDMKAQLGGLAGRRLKSGDSLKFGPVDKYYKKRLIAETGNYFEQLKKNQKKIRVIEGPQWEAFSTEAKETFFSTTYLVGNDSDRMGIRLLGEKIEHLDSADIITDSIVFGAIQIPGNGTPIIMMADRQTSGGYTKIANVISEDLPILAQSKPGDAIVFEQIEIKKCADLSQMKLISEPQLLENAAHYVVKITDKSSERLYHVHIETLTNPD